MTRQITQKSKKEILRLTSFLSGSFVTDFRTNILHICDDESINIFVDDYDNYFDGVVVYDKGQFNIHLNKSKGNLPDSKRGRYTISHELGHYFLDAHREGIRKGIISPYPTNLSLVHNEYFEAEADYFASCLLLPQERLRSFTGGRPFSLKVLQEVSESFDVSLTASAIRFAEVGTHELMIVFSERNIVKWFTKSHDFPNLPFKFKVGQSLPPTSVAGEFFRKPENKFTGIEEVQLDDWFYPRSGAPDSDLYEQCFYSDLFGYVISLIWFR